MEFLYFLSDLRSPFGDLLVQGTTYLAQETVAIAIICWLFWCSNKRLAYTLGFSYFASGLLVQGMKVTFRVPRPWIIDPSFNPVASAVPDATGYSFPSGHTQSITALMGTLGLWFKNIFGKIICFFLIVAVMFSRMYLGVHTPKDVLVSFLVSFLCVFFMYRLFYISSCTDGKEKIVSIIMSLLCLALAVYAALLQINGTVPHELAEDCVKAAGAGLAFAIGYYVEKRYICFSLPETLKKKILRLIIGLAVALIIQKGLKPILGTTLPASFVRYFLVILWVTIIYPFLFSKKTR